MTANPPFALLRQDEVGWIAYREPVAVVRADSCAEVATALARAEALVESDGLTAVGFVAYEAAPAFDPAFRVRPETRFPLVWLGLFKHGEPCAGPVPAASVGVEPCEWFPELSAAAYRSAFAQVRAAHYRGDCYQANLSLRLRARSLGDPSSRFAEMVAAQPTAYACFLDTGDWAVCSVSPELFFSRDGSRIQCRPMKGTAPRGRDAAADRQTATALRETAKERAENLMIVDMIRNDLGRLALPGSVAVPELFRLEGYATVWQMTSSIVARADVSTAELFGALFPCASITGAPKIATMRLLAELECSPRRIFTGAIGTMAPERQARFAVAIRTLLIDKASGDGEYGVGSGVVWDSSCAAEWRECWLKARVMTDLSVRASLLETLRWTPQRGFDLLERHLARLAAAARDLDYAWRETDVRTALDDAVQGATGATRVRLLLGADGSHRVQTAALDDASAEPARLRWARQRVSSTNPMLRYKTSRRDFYDLALSERPDCDDVIFVNERGEVTETTIANLVCEIDGQRLTPALECGLLPGTLRAELLARGEIIEAVIDPTRLAQAQRLWCINSVRGWRAAVLVEPLETRPSVIASGPAEDRRSGGSEPRTAWKPREPTLN